MEYYSLRVTIVDDTKPVILFLQKFETCCYILEKGKHGDNPHLHIYFETDIKNKTLRTQLRNLGLTGNKAYSLKVCDSRYPVPYLSYMMKQSEMMVESTCCDEISFFVFYFNNIPDDILAEASAHNDEVRKAVRSKKSQISDVEEYVRSKLPPLKKNDIKHNDEDVLRLIISYYHDHGLMIRKFHIMALFDTLLIRLSPIPECALQDLAGRWYTFR